MTLDEKKSADKKMFANISKNDAQIIAVSGNSYIQDND